jgi:hypothetical protein
MRRSCAELALLTLAGVLLGAPTLAAQEPPQEKPAEAGKLAVSIQYTGKGTVDSDHRIWIWVFDTPNISANSMPVASASLSENGGTNKFFGLPKEVYLAVAYDEKGGYDGSTGPPPPGTPIMIHGMTPEGTGSPVPTGGDDAVLKTSFDDSVRMP